MKPTKNYFLPILLNWLIGKNFFIAKAIGWALREYAKTNQNNIEQFLHSSSVQSLSRREAQKHF